MDYGVTVGHDWAAFTFFHFSLSFPFEYLSYLSLHLHSPWTLWELSNWDTKIIIIFRRDDHITLVILALTVSTTEQASVWELHPWSPSWVSTDAINWFQCSSTSFLSHKGKNTLSLYWFRSWHIWLKKNLPYLDWHILDVFVAQSLSHVWLLCDPMDSYIHGTFQARILERVAISFSRGSFWPRDQTHFSCIARQILYHWATR